MSEKVLLICRVCCKWKMIDRDESHPPKTEIEVQKCPGCWDSDFDDSDYYDSDFNSTNYS